MIEITPDLSIDEGDLELHFIPASGPGGQNVNKVASRVQLRFSTHTPSLPEEVRIRLRNIARNRINADGELIIDAGRFRSQEQNRQDAIDRLVALIHQATIKPKARKKTKPSLAVRQRRLEAKRLRSSIKKLRRPVYAEGE